MNRKKGRKVIVSIFNDKAFRKVWVCDPRPHIRLGDGILEPVWSNLNNKDETEIIHVYYFKPHYFLSPRKVMEQIITWKLKGFYTKRKVFMVNRYLVPSDFVLFLKYRKLIHQRLLETIKKQKLHKFPIKLISNVLALYTVLHNANFRFLSKVKPSVVVLVNEYGPWERTLLLTSKFMNIRTVAVQHGEITETHCGYVYPKSYIVGIKKGRIPIPDYIILYGHWYKQLLARVGYPKERLLVFGQPRYDILKHLNEIFEKSEIIREFGLDDNKKILVWTTQTHGLSDEENKRNVEVVFSVVKKFSDKLQLVIKLHPSEDQTASLYKSASERFNLPIKIIGGKEDTFKLLYVADAVMTKHSTTGLEALMIGKPLIVLNLMGDDIEYVKNRVAFEVRNETDFLEVVKKLINGRAICNKKLIERYLLGKVNLGGDTTEKLSSFLKKFV